MSDAVKGNSDIKIYVSERIDQKAELIDNPLFVPIRCGAVFDKRSDVNMLGDNTGDNISERRLSFCELTVLYWAWKILKQIILVLLITGDFFLLLMKELLRFPVMGSSWDI